MNLLRALSFNLKTEVIGKAALRFERLQSERKMKKPHKDQNPNLAPLLNTVPHLKELISTHYLHGRYADTYKKVAWVTSGAPADILKALGYFTYYPENHGAVCGVRRKVVELSSVSEDLGYCRDLCSYARTDIGSVISGKTPVGNLPKPDLLLCCTNICQTVLYWYQVLADHFKVPLIIIDTPYIYDRVTDHAVTYVTRQMEEAVEIAERISGRTLTDKMARQTAQASKEAMLLWNEILACCRHHPSPISAFDQFFFMAPIVDMRGEQATVDFYARVLAEIKQRMADGTGMVTNEKKRLLWDNLPIWHYVRPLAEMLAEDGFCIVVSTYTNAWAELGHMIEIDSLIKSVSRLCLHVILNQSPMHKLKTMTQMIKDYDVDGVILHNNRSCKPYSIGQIDQREHLKNELGIPALLLEADHNDPRLFSEEQAVNRLKAFMEIIAD